MKIILTGAQGTGKTTILNELAKLGYPVITEVVRNLHKDGVNINKDGDAEGQNIIYNTYKKLFSEKEEFVSDRGLTDVLAYTTVMVKEDKDNMDKMDTWGDQWFDFMKFAEQNKDILYFYFPIEFEVVDDGVRSLDEEYRRDIDKNIRCILNFNNIDYITVRGTVEQRLNLIKTSIEKYKKD